MLPLNCHQCRRMMGPMELLSPASVEELAEHLRQAKQSKRRILLEGASSKRRMGGPVAPSDIHLTTLRLDRVVRYEPRDLTLSVQAGMRMQDLAALIAQDGLMVPLDPPYFDRATVGGTVAANASGPRRRGYGTARDMVIGMKFVTVDGAVVDSGGMVVKNAAGYDLSKLMIGSFGTLAAIAVVNFRLFPIPPATETYLIARESVEEIFAVRDAILRSVLQPVATDLLTPGASARVGREGFILAVQASGPAAVLPRYRVELARYGPQILAGPEEQGFWIQVREFVPAFVDAFAGGCVVRVSTTLMGLKDVVASTPVPCLARAGSGVAYLCFFSVDQAIEWLGHAREHQWRAVVEFRPAAQELDLELWPQPGDDLRLMQRIKQLFDPDGLLNPGRLYGRI